MLYFRVYSEIIDGVMMSDVRDGPNHVVTNGATYAEVVPRSQRTQVQETSAATSIVVENTNPAVSNDMCLLR